MTEIIMVSDGQMVRNIEVQAGHKADMVLLIMPGVSCDVKLDIRLAGEGAEANVYGAYVCGGQEKVMIAVDMHHDVMNFRMLSGAGQPWYPASPMKEAVQSR